METTLPLKETPTSDVPMKVARRSSAPNGVASNVKQLVVLARDRSTSMEGDKISELNLAGEALRLELADPVNKDGFVMLVVDFNHSAQVVVQNQPASSVIMPEAVADGNTCFNAPLELIVRELNAFKAQPNPDGWHYLRPQVLFLSDGQAEASDENIANIQELANVTAIAYGDDADHDILAGIASDGKVHHIGTDGGALRAFLAEVGKTLTESKQKVQ